MYHLCHAELFQGRAFENTINNNIYRHNNEGSTDFHNHLTLFQAWSKQLIRNTAFMIASTYLRDTLLRKLKKYLSVSMVLSFIRQESNSVADVFSLLNCWALMRASCRSLGMIGSGNSLKNCLRSPATSHGCAVDRQFSPWSSLLYSKQWQSLKPMPYKNKTQKLKKVAYSRNSYSEF